MSISVFFLTIKIFIIVLLIHILIWRISRPKKDVTYVFLIFLIIPLFLYLSLFFINLFAKFTALYDFLASALLYFSLACAYIQTYPVIQASAPSLQIVYLIGNSPEGLTEEEITGHFNLDNLVTDRVEDLITEKFIYEKDGILTLANKGKILGNIFYAYRKLYGINAGKG